VSEIDGLWTAKFATSQGSGSGVVTLSEGRITGGDTNYYYVGTYAAQGSSITASLRVIHFVGPLNNVFGPIRELVLSISGSIGGRLVMATAHSPSAPFLKMSLRLEQVVSFGDKR
jgi:hypothetical protein